MKKAKFINILLAVFLVLYQTVFLFTPINLVQATNPTVEFINIPTGTVSGIVPVSIQTSEVAAITTLHFDGPGGDDFVPIYDQENNIYTYYWDTTAENDGNHYIWGKAVFSGGIGDINTSSPYVISVTVDNSSTPSYNIDLINPSFNSTVSGMVQIQAQVTLGLVDEKVKFHWLGSGLGMREMYYQGAGQYYYDVYTENEGIINGSYQIYAFILDNQGYKVAQSDYINFTLDNQTEASVEASFINPQSGVTVSGTYTVQAEVVSNVDINQVKLRWPGSGADFVYMNYQSGNLYNYSWQTTNWNDGQYQMQIYVKYDNYTSTYESDIITVYIANDSGGGSCTMSCNTSPGCRTSLTKGYVTSGACCGNGYCYTCNNDYSWDGSNCVAGSVLCYADGCNGDCPPGCVGTDDPDCGCYNNNGCCGIGCSNTTDNDCSTETDYILNMNIVSAPTIVSGNAYFSVQTSEEANVTFSILQGGIELKQYPSTYEGNKVYSINWDTTNLADGQYTVEAYANKTGYIDTSKQVDVTVDNFLEYEDTTPPAGDTQSNISIFFNKAPNYITSPTFISIQTSEEVDSVNFYISGPKNQSFTATHGGSNQYYFNWDIANYPDGMYQVKAIAKKDSQSYSNSTNIEIKTNTYPDELLPPTTDDIYPSEQPYEPPKEPLMPYIDEILPECSKYGITTAEKCKQFMSMHHECREKGFLTRAECDNYMMVPPECRDQGLSQEECDKQMMVPPECRDQGIVDELECKRYMYQSALPYECQEAGVTSQEECNQVIFIQYMPYECKQAGATAKEECDEIFRNQSYLTYECEQAGITSPEECDKYMMEKHMPIECEQAGVTTREECDFIMREKYGDFDKMAGMDFGPASEMYMPIECEQAGITSPEECDRYMMEMHMPEECKEAGVTTKEECAIILFQKHAPQECVNAGITTPEECEKHMFEKYAPDDCRQAGILTMEACEKYMFEKYGGMENISLDKFPLECRNAGATTVDQCDKVMKELYMPRECRDQGLTEENECEFYMQQKYMPQECRDAGATTRSECDKIMFNKFAPKECQLVGILDGQECEEFMFNKYAPKVECQGVEDWQCRNSIKERHLGNIVTKQVQFDEIKEKIMHIVGESITVEDLENILELAREIIPVKGKEVGLKVVAAEEKLILDEAENLIQTAPVAFMIDTDQDGLSDDMEVRLGTDPNNADSDNDGYNDGIEVTGNYNPLGSGELLEILAPIDQAILTNQTLGQPKTDGEVSEDLTVDKIINLTDEQGQEEQGYNFSGQAEPNSVVTLYIYSDLPMVATTKVDEYGNWQYEFSKSLIEGEHEVYVVVNDNTGRVLAKSNPLNFFIKEAKAVSVKDFVATSVVAPTNQSESMIWRYMFMATMAVISGLILFIAFIIQKRRTSIKG